MPAQVLGVRVVADVVGLTLGTGGAEGQAVAVPLHLLHLQREKTQILALPLGPEGELFWVTFPPMRGRMCILPVWACFTDDTMRQVPLSVT